jgi:hypothetical protein
MKLFALFLTASASTCLGATAGGFPSASEHLDYSINWQSGLALGEAHLKADLAQTGGWKFELTAEAAFPGFPLKDAFTSSATANLCSVEFSKDSSHGSHQAHETTSISGRVATRKTDKGGKAEIPVSDCAKDALTFLFFARRELSHGKVPAAQELLFGAVYSVQLTYKGSAKIAVAGADVLTDRMHLKGKGPAADFEAELYFARDAARTPMLVTIPSSLGTFRMELVR